MSSSDAAGAGRENLDVGTGGLGSAVLDGE
jgi:hypothetical protein